MTAKAKKLAARYNLQTDIVEIAEQILEETRRYHVNAFLNPLCPVIVAGKELAFKNWGLIPFWIKNAQDAKEIRNKTLNARSETIFEKPSFREPVKNNRYIIPSTGYFEYHHIQKETMPYFIYLKDEPVFSIGGIMDRWRNPENGEVINTFSIITTPANELTGWIHNGGNNPGRMPFIIPKAWEEKWLDPATPKEEIREIMKAYPAASMDAYAIKKDFIKKDPQDPTITDAA